MSLNDKCPGFDNYVSTLRDGNGGLLYPDHPQLLADITGEVREYFLTLQQEWQAIVDKILKLETFRNSHRPQVRVGLLGSLEFNAFAGRDEVTQSYFIGMILFAKVRLHMIWHRLMNQPGVMPSVGNAAEEVDRGLERIDILKLGIDLNDLKVPGELRPRFGPRACDPIRVDFAQFASDTGMRFLVLHELSHIMCGHVGHLGRSAANKGFFAENHSMPSRAPISSYEVMEFQADDYAVIHMIRAYLSGLANNGPLSNKITRFVRELDATVFTLTSSIYLVFRTFYQLRGSTQPNWECLASEGHPHPIVRAGAMISRIVGEAILMLRRVGKAKLLAPDDGRTVEEVEAGITAAARCAVEEVEAGIAAVSTLEAIHDVATQVFDLRVMKHFLALLDRIDTLADVPLFLKHSTTMIENLDEHVNREVLQREIDDLLGRINTLPE